MQRGFKGFHSLVGRGGGDYQMPCGMSHGVDERGVIFCCKIWATAKLFRLTKKKKRTYQRKVLIRDY